MSDLTEDEMTVLMIAAQGESMMPINRWEKPVESLVRKGYLEQLNKFNNVITPAGREAVEHQEKKYDQALTDVLRASIDRNNKRATAANSVEEAAKLMAAAVKLSSDATGDSHEQAARKWFEVLLKRTLELAQ